MEDENNQNETNSCADEKNAPATEQYNENTHWTRNAKDLGFPNIAQEVYQDSLKMPLQEVSKLVTTPILVLNILLEPLRGVVFAYEEQKKKYLSSLSEKLKDVPLERIEPPPIEIAGPTLDAIRYTGDHAHLRELFTNLLASSIDSKTVVDVHPAFVSVIQSLTSNDAKLLKCIARKRPTRAGLGYKKDIKTEDQIRLEHTADPQLENLKLNLDIAYNNVKKAFAQFTPEPIVSVLIAEGFENIAAIGLALLEEFTEPEEQKLVCTKSLNNLLRLRIFDISYNPASAEDELTLKDSKTLKRAPITASLLITDFGEDFIKTCVLEHSSLECVKNPT